MNLRIARHTENLDKLVHFYQSVMGFHTLSQFLNHDGYDGVMLGIPNSDWHLEFTQSRRPPIHNFDEDDLLVFYVHSVEEINAILKDAALQHIFPQESKNPYWLLNGKEILDPDGYRIILSIMPRLSKTPAEMIYNLEKQGVSTWGQLLSYLRHLPYGRNSSRNEPNLVLVENCGTCSSKHALAKIIADANSISGVRLILSMYKMNSSNTPGLGDILSQHALEYLPEAHCYLEINGKAIDITTATSDYHTFKNDIIIAFEIVPEQCGEYKVKYHQKFLKQWILDNQIPYDFEEIWSIREQCIQNLANPKI